MKKLVLIALIFLSTNAWADSTDRSVERVLNDVWDDATNALNVSGGTSESVTSFGAVGDGVTDDYAAFTAALASDAMEITVPDGVYMTSATIVIPAAENYYRVGKKLTLSPGAIIKPMTDINVIQLANKARISGGVIDTTDLSSPVKAMIYLVSTGAADGINQGTGADNIFLIGGPSAGTGGIGIELDVDAANANIAYGSYYSSSIINCKYGIKIHAAAAGGDNYANGNQFTNFNLTNNTHGVYLDGTNTNSNQVESNRFSNFQVQTKSGTSTEGLYVSSKFNMFTNFKIWDVVAPTVAYNFTSTSQYNTFISDNNALEQFNTPKVDSGVRNYFPQNFHAEFLGYADMVVSQDSSGYATSWRAINNGRTSSQFMVAGVHGDGAADEVRAYFGVSDSADDPTGYDSTDKLIHVDTAGDVGLGIADSSAKLHVFKTLEQLRLGYDANNYISETVGSNGITTIETVGTADAIRINTGGFSNNLSIVDGQVGVNTAAPLTTLDIRGTGLRDSNVSFNKKVAVQFPNGVANQKVDFFWTGTQAFSGIIDFTVVDAFSSQNAIGGITKRFYLGVAAGGTINKNESRYLDEGGATADNYAISDLSWDAGNSRYKITLVHRVSTGNNPQVHIKVLGRSTSEVTVLQTISGDAVYTSDSTAYSRPYIAFNKNVLMASADAGVVLKQGVNGKVGTFVCNGTTPVVVGNTSIVTSDAVIISLGIVGGTVGATPHVATITAATGFTTVGTASDTSTYNYTVISNAT